MVCGRKYQWKFIMTSLSDLWLWSNHGKPQVAKSMVSTCWTWKDIQNCPRPPLCLTSCLEVKSQRKVKFQTGSNGKSSCVNSCHVGLGQTTNNFNGDLFISLMLKWSKVEKGRISQNTHLSCDCVICLQIEFQIWIVFYINYYLSIKRARMIVIDHAIFDVDPNRGRNSTAMFWTRLIENLTSFRRRKKQKPCFTGGRTSQVG